MSTSVIVETREGIATITLNRPDARNAITVDLLDRLRVAMAAADADADVGAVVLTGADPAFCAGLDLKELGGDGPRIDLTPTPGTTPDSHPWRPITKPVIGAVKGPAVTGGLELALHCDILIASESAVFADTHARVGVMPGWGLSVLLPQAVGWRMARRMSFTGDFIDAGTALRCGLVTDVVPDNRLQDRAREVALTIVHNDRKAVTALLSSYRRIEEGVTTVGYSHEADTAHAWALASTDHARRASERRSAVMERGRSQK